MSDLPEVPADVRAVITERQAECLRTYKECAGSARATAKALGKCNTTVTESLEGVRQAVARTGRMVSLEAYLDGVVLRTRRRPEREVAASTDAHSEEPERLQIIIRGSIEGRPRRVLPLPRRGQVRRHLFTCAQNNTHVHEAVWLNVLAMASRLGADVMVGTVSYQKAAYGAKSVKRGSLKGDEGDSLWYDPQITEHIVDEQVQLAPGLVWCGELNIIPTAPDPLSSLESHNGRQSNVVPHVKMHLSSVPSIGDEATKFNYTTGTITQRNYIDKKAGEVAERYHAYGALLVEVCHDGSWFVRQLEASASDGWSIRDLDLKAKDGVVTEGNPVAALVVGDVHVRVIDRGTQRVIWSPGGMLDVLQPALQVLHDVIDFRSRNHHEQRDPLLMHRKWEAGEEGVEDEVREVVDFLADDATRPWCDTVVAPSNHHEAMQRWLNETEWRQDPVNASFYHRAWSALLDDREEDIFKWACSLVQRHPYRLRFLRTDESLVVAKDADGGWEVGMHGHLGPDGARGNVKGFAKLGRRSMFGHGHGAKAYLWAWMVGTASRMRIGYNRGPSSWSSTHGVIYPEGTAQLITVWKGRWRA